MRKMQLCSRSGHGESPYEARIIHGPFELEADGLKFNVVIVKAIDDDGFNRSVILCRSGLRIGRVATARLGATCEANVRRLWAALEKEFGAEARKRIESAPSLQYANPVTP